MIISRPRLILFVAALLVTGCSSDSRSSDAATSKDGNTANDLVEDTRAPDLQPDEQGTSPDTQPDTRADLPRPDALTDSQPDTLASDGSTGCGSVANVGCCAEQKVLHWCDNGVLKIVQCAPESCGWDLVLGEYLCGSGEDFVGEDPSSTHPRACP